MAPPNLDTDLATKARGLAPRQDVDNNTLQKVTPSLALGSHCLVTLMPYLIQTKHQGAKQFSDSKYQELL